MKNKLVDTVLCYLRKEDKYLLLLRNKKKNDYNANKWIGVGGKVEPGETIDEAAIREVKEETGYDVGFLKCAGEVLFINDDYQEMMYVYEITDFKGQQISCDEGELQWIPLNKIYDYPMWEGDKAFLPKLINHEPYFKMCVTYSQDILVCVKTL